MGKLLLLLALGISSLTGFYFQKSSSTIPQNKNLASKISEDSRAMAIADSGVKIFLERLKKEKSLSGNFTGNKILGGEYSIYISGSDSNLVIRSISSYQNSNHEVIVKANRSQLKLPTMQAALNLSSKNLKASLGDNIEIKIDGEDNSMRSDRTNKFSDILVPSVNDSAYLTSLINSDCEVSVGLISAGWVDDYSDLISSSDITLPGGVYSSDIFLGDVSHPRITYITGNVHFAGQYSGNGILIVNGDLKLSGEFSYKGLIIVNSSSNVSFSAENKSRIDGCVIIASKNIDVKIKDYSKIVFDPEETIDITKKLKSSKVEINSWW